MAVVADEGDLCDLPTFDFPWPDSVNPNLAVELKKTGKLVIRIVGRGSEVTMSRSGSRCAPTLMPTVSSRIHHATTTRGGTGSAST